MNVNKLKRSLKSIGFIVCLCYSCNLDYAPSMISTSIVESKKRGFFLFEYDVDSLIIADKRKLFLIKKVWIEKSHTSTMSSLGKENFQTDSTLNQVVFDLDQDSYFKSDNFSHWIICGEKGALGSLEGRMISVGVSRKETSKRIRFQVYALKSPNQINHDTVKVAEFVLKKR